LRRTTRPDRVARTLVLHPSSRGRDRVIPEVADLGGVPG